MIKRVVKSGNTCRSLIWLLRETYHKVIKYGQSETEVGGFYAFCLSTDHKLLVCPAHSCFSEQFDEFLKSQRNVTALAGSSLGKDWTLRFGTCRVRSCSVISHHMELAQS